MAAAGAPSLFAALRRARVAAAARDLAGDLARLRGEAVAGRRTVAMRLTWDAGRYTYRLYADGDGDGVRGDDIAAGRDAALGTARDLRSRFDGVDFGLLDVAIPEVPPAAGALPPSGDPVRFGRSDTISFTPAGTASSGTLYVSDGHATVRAVVVYGGTGRVRIWGFDRALWRWTR